MKRFLFIFIFRPFYLTFFEAFFGNFGKSGKKAKVGKKKYKNPKKC